MENEVKKLMDDITQRIQDLKDDYSLSVKTKDVLIKENMRILTRCQQLHLDNELFCDKINKKNVS